MASEIETPAKPTTFYLTTKQQQFFQRHKQMLVEIQAAMKGALQLIIDENELSA